MSIPFPDFDPYKPPTDASQSGTTFTHQAGMTNPEGSTATSGGTMPEEKKEVPLNVSPNIKIDYNIMSIQLLTMNIHTMNDLNMYQVPPQDVSPLAYLFNTRPGAATPPPAFGSGIFERGVPPGPPPPPGGASRPSSTHPPGAVGISLPTLPLGGSSRVPGLHIQGVRHVHDSNRTPPTSRSEGFPLGSSPESKSPSPLDQPPVTIRVSSSESIPKIGDRIPLGDPTLPKPPVVIQQRTASHAPSDLGRESEEGIIGPISSLSGLPSAPSIHMTRVVYKRLPGLDDILSEKPKPPGRG